MSYQPLFAITVVHSFFSNHAGLRLDFVLSPPAQRVVANADLLIRAEANRLMVFYNDQNFDALQLYIQERKNGLNFDFDVYARDPHFENFTELTPDPPGSVPYFASGVNPRKTQEGIDLPVAGYLTSEELQAPKQPGGMVGLNGKSQTQKPNFRVTVTLAEQWLVPEADQVDLREYVIRFEARKTYWKYSLLGPLADKDPRIIDLQGQVQFQSAGQQTPFPDKRAAVIYSTEPIALCDRPQNRFQLRENASVGEKILVKRLPNGSPENISRDVVEGKEAYVSEIYVNY